MSVQVIMKDGRPEWAVIPYAEYEALLAKASRAPVVSAVEADSAPVESVQKIQAPAFSRARLAALKQSVGKDTAAIAKDAGISPVYCRQIEQGEREPSEAIIRGLAQALSVSPEQLME